MLGTREICIDPRDNIWKAPTHETRQCKEIVPLASPSIGMHPGT